jgi:hypothetical protein
MVASRQARGPPAASVVDAGAHGGSFARSVSGVNPARAESVSVEASPGPACRKAGAALRYVVTAAAPPSPGVVLECDGAEAAVDLVARFVAKPSSAASRY